MKDKMVLVHWIDHCSGGGHWIKEEELSEVRICKCESLGFIAFEDKENLILVQTISEELVLNYVCIYKGCITYRKNL